MFYDLTLHSNWIKKIPEKFLWGSNFITSFLGNYWLPVFQLLKNQKKKKF